MVMAIAKAGRPHAVAEIDYDTDKAVALRAEFYAACSSLNYREIMALSRALGVTPVTVSNWKYKIYFPNYNTAHQVIDWVRRGKPMRLEAPWQSAVDMF
jgi:hypothetical protein